MNRETELIRSQLAILNLKAQPLKFCDRDALLVVEKLGGEGIPIEGPLLYRQAEGMVWGQRHIVAQLPNGVIVALSDPFEQVYDSLENYIETCIQFIQD